MALPSHVVIARQDWSVLLAILPHGVLDFFQNGLGKFLFRPSFILRQSSIYVLIFQTQTSSIFH
jgi:hypothetical protein